MRDSKLPLLLALGLLLGACQASDEQGSPPPTLPQTDQPRELGRACSADDDCVSGTCLTVIGPGGPSAFCTQPCETDDDCSDLAPVCGVGPDGSPVCAFACDGIHHYGFSCGDDDRPVACGPDATVCDQCGCPEGMRCTPGVGCGEQSEVGGPCAFDGDCTSDNCSFLAQVCRVPLGSACTDRDCDSCLSDGDEHSYCSRECVADAQCNGGICVWDGVNALCVQRCEGPSDESCPGTCQPEPNSPRFYCAL